MSELIRDGVRLVYEVAGAGDPAMVFVHGWTSDRSYFEPQVEHFSKTHRCVSVDLRGHGESDAPKQEYTIEAFADDVAAICDELGVKDAALVGHSMGGAIVLAMSMRRPDIVRSVAMLDPAILFPTETRGFMLQLADAFGAPGGMKTLRDFQTGQFFLPTSDPALKERLLDDALKTPPHVVASAFKHIASFDAEAPLRALTMPLLLVDAGSVLRDHALVVAAQPSVVLGRTVGSGHFHQLEVPDQINAMLERFLAISSR